MDPRTEQLNVPEPGPGVALFRQWAATLEALAATHTVAMRAKDQALQAKEEVIAAQVELIAELRRRAELAEAEAARLARELHLT